MPKNFHLCILLNELHSDRKLAEETSMYKEQLTEIQKQAQKWSETANSYIISFDVLSHKFNFVTGNLSLFGFLGFDFRFLISDF